MTPVLNVDLDCLSFWTLILPLGSDFLTIVNPSSTDPSKGSVGLGSCEPLVFVALSTYSGGSSCAFDAAALDCVRERVLLEGDSFTFSTSSGSEAFLLEGDGVVSDSEF